MTKVNANIAIGSDKLRAQLTNVRTGAIMRELATNQLEEFHELSETVRRLFTLDGKKPDFRRIVVATTGTVRRGLLQRNVNWDGRNIVHAMRKLGADEVVALPAAAAGALAERIILDKDSREVTLGHVRDINVAYVDWGHYLVAATSRGEMPRVASLDHVTVSGQPPFSACSCGEERVGHLDTQIAGRNIEDRFGKSFEDLDATNWDKVTRDLVTGLRHLVDATNCSRIVMSGYMTDLLTTELVSIKGIQDGLHKWHGSSYEHVEVTTPLCGHNSVLFGARLVSTM